MHPLVGITCGFIEDLGRFAAGADYVSAISASGGLPLLIPYQRETNIEDVLSKIDGLLLSGGGDIDPIYFEEEPHPLNGYVDPLRDSFEITLTKQALEKGLPILGICRGMQVLNVADGGGICQDISISVNSPLQHNQQAPRWYPTHNIKIVDDSLLMNILGNNSLRVNSFHHQIIDRLGTNLVVSARSGDRVAEAIENKNKKKFTLGLQFHPENMFIQYPHILSIFIAFIKASTRFMSTKS